ncbi:MAG TPA: hypothetical protein VK451_12585 [Methyloceanibacter sp.]|nr:hypothetical protein [Methyloceanibacter sp.]
MTMRSSIALALAIIFGLFLLATFANQGSAVPIEAGRLPLSLERLMDNPVIQVKLHCKEKDMCTGCTVYCDKYKHSDYCQEHHDDPSCCKHHKKKCVCVPCLDHAVPQ